MPLTRQGLIAGASAAHGDAFSTPGPERVARRRLIAFALFGIASYAVAMIATIPASVVFNNQPWRTGVAGTIWNGEVGLAGGSTLRWSWSPLRSITSLGFAADWKMTGPDTDMAGRVLAGPWSTVIDKASGTADASILAAIQPDLPFTCDLNLQVEIERAAMGGSSQMFDGRVASDPGTCSPKKAGAASAVPALILTGEKIGPQTRIRLAPMAQRRKVLIDAALSEGGMLDLTVTPDGATMLPFLGSPPGAKIQGRI